MKLNAKASEANLVIQLSPPSLVYFLTMANQSRSSQQAIAQARVAFAALHHADYRRYFFVIMLAQMGDNIEHVISYWLLYQKFHSPVLAGFAVISHWTPFLFFAVYFGALADRHDCRRVIQTAQAMYALVSLTWGILFLTDTIEVWHACALLVLHGMAGVLGRARQPTDYSRYRRPRISAERGALEFHGAQHRDPLWSRPSAARRCCCSAGRPDYSSMCSCTCR